MEHLLIYMQLHQAYVIQFNPHIVLPQEIAGSFPGSLCEAFHLYSVFKRYSSQYCQSRPPAEPSAAPSHPDQPCIVSATSRRASAPSVSPDYSVSHCLLSGKLLGPDIMQNVFTICRRYRPLRCRQNHRCSRQSRCQNLFQRRSIQMNLAQT